MLFPSKFTSFEESTISQMIKVLENKQTKININQLYQKLKKQFQNIDEFVYVLDALYALGYIEIENEDLIYVKRD